MPSRQARILNLVIRLLVKRRPRKTEEQNVRMVRKILGNPPKFMRAKVPPEIAIREVTVGGIRGEWVQPRDATEASPCVLYLHGGGYVACSPVTHRPLTIALARAARARVFVPDYRLAPEHRFPAAIEDAMSVYRWLLMSGEDTDNLVIAGDSAGGGLTLATMIALREAQEMLPAGAICMSPWTDLAGTGKSLVANTKRDVMFHGEGVKQAGRIYLGDTPADHPLASPVYAELGGLPPLLIYISDTEVLLDDSVRVAERARSAGTEVRLEVWKDLPHVWPVFVRYLPEARQAVGQMAEFIRERCVAPADANAERLMNVSFS